jgi:branched-chain amino acid transport system permease protein
MNLSYIVQVLLSGLSAGAAYGLIGIGFGLVYRMSGVLNFAQGELVSLPVFLFLLAVGGGAAVAVVGASPAALAAGAAAAVLITVLAAVAVQRVGVAPFLARGSVMGWIAATAAAGILIQSLIALRFTAESYTVPDVVPVGLFGRGGVIDLPGGGVLELRLLWVLAVALALAFAFNRWLGRSTTGRAMRAAAEAPDAARLCGVSPERLQLFAWGIAGLLGAIGGLLISPGRPVTLGLGAILGLKGVTAAAIGRLGSARGAVAGGLALGVGEAVITSTSLPAISLGWLQLPRLGPASGVRDVIGLLALVVLLAAVPGRLGGAVEAVD